ncbi:hypothetical protein [Stutzerimonas nitrititolerans]|uniref:hypothetical protein n=1 Tax=Stutzerimonas nitrititolerans TaxID=2482751 RepID=UPI0028B131C8|nr:hypothetical protein [Stutzerimonas nitrititolerans]
MTDQITTLSAAVPFRDTCGKALSDIPGGEAAADRLCEVYGYPPKSIRTQTQLAAALMQSDKVLTKIAAMLGAPEQRDPEKAEAAAKFFDAYNKALGVLLQGFAMTLAPKIKDNGDLASKQAIRLFNDLAKGKSDASAEDWQQLTRLLNHTKAQGKPQE